MIVNNRTSFAVIAFCWDDKAGYSEDVVIEAGETATVSGPRKPSQYDSHYQQVMSKEITCHEGPDDDDGYQVAIGHQMCIGHGQTGITIRHHSEDRIIKHFKLNCGTEHPVNTENCAKFGFTYGQRVIVRANGKKATIRGVSGLPYGMRDQGMVIKTIDEEVLWIHVDGDPGMCCVLDPDRDLQAT